MSDDHSPVAAVLLVDSLASYRRVVSSLLSDRELTVHEAGTSAAARKILGRESIAVAVVEATLPDGSGGILAREALDAHPGLQILLVTNPTAADADAEALAEANPAVQLLEGPVHPGTLATRVSLLVSGDEPQPRPRVSTTPPRHTGGGTDHANQVLREIQREYQDKLPAKLVELVELVEAVRRSPDQAAILDLKQAAHAVHGTAGTLGFAEASLAAATAERCAIEALDGADDDASCWDVPLQALRRAVDAPEKLSLQADAPFQFDTVATVLMVEQDPAALEQSSALARRNLVEVFGATEPLAALALAETQRLDGSIIDLDLGEERAFDLAGSLRSLPGLAELPIAFSSSDGSLPNRVAAASAGAQLFLKKPLDPEELKEAVRGFLAARSSTAPKILLVDDDEFFLSHVAAILEQEGMDVTCLREPEQVLDVTNEVLPDLVLLDVSMPGMSGFDVCLLLRSTAAWKELPILFLTAEHGADTRLECFATGGDDFIEKPVIREELLARIGVRLERARLAKDRADRDALTGLNNRRAFLELFKLRVADATRNDRPVSLGVIDLDHFKRVNDDHGHLVGDRVLAAMGRLLAARFRSVDIRGRWGGEEFAVAFYGEDGATARKILGRVLKEFRKLEFTGDDGREFSASFSAGVATFPVDGDSFDAMFRVADRRLYEAKETGRNRIV